jgi:hypothetical protein
MEPTAFELAPLEASHSTMPAYTDRTPVGGRPGGVLADPSSGCGDGDHCAGLTRRLRGHFSMGAQ